MSKTTRQNATRPKQIQEAIAQASALPIAAESIKALNERKPATVAALRAFIMSLDWDPVGQVIPMTVSFIEAFCRSDLTAEEIRKVNDVIISFYESEDLNNRELDLEENDWRIIASGVHSRRFDTVRESTNALKPEDIIRNWSVPQ